MFRIFSRLLRDSSERDEDREANAILQRAAELKMIQQEIRTCLVDELLGGISPPPHDGPERRHEPR